MSVFHAALGGMVTATGVGMVMVGRSWPTLGRHRARVLDDDTLLDELLGPPSPYTEPEHAPSVIRQGFNDCPTCDRTTAGVVTSDGWWCGECLQPAAGGEA